MVNIAVLVKQVPDTNSKIQISGDRVDLSSVKMDISPYDEFAVENALQHKESTGGTVSAITVGGAAADKVLKGVKALGVDNIIRLDYDGFMDSNGLQSIIAEEIIAGGYDIVYCGKSAADTGAGSTGPGIAERLGWASVSNATEVKFADALTVSYPTEGGDAIVSLNLPAVVSCDKGSIKVRKSNVKGIMMAKKAQVDVKPVSPPAASVTVVSQVMPPANPLARNLQAEAPPKQSHSYSETRLT